MRWFVAIALLTMAGCQGTPGGGLGSWNQPARVPPPATGSFQVPGSYSGTTGTANSTSATAAPWMDTLTDAQNQLNRATDDARTAVSQTTGQINGQVEQASAKLDQIGSGVVQASQVLTQSIQDPPPAVPMQATLPPGMGAPPPAAAPQASGRIGDTPEDPNAQWRKPVPR